MVSRSPRQPVQPPEPSRGPSLFDLLSEKPKPKEPEHKGFTGLVARTELKVRAVWDAIAWERVLRALGTMAFVGALGAAYVWRAPLMDHMTTFVARSTGAVVQRIVVTGAAYTHKDDLQAALHLQKGDSLVGFDAASARARIETLPWVRLASVDRQLPDTVNVTVYEHIPLARLIAENAIWVINKDGERIVSDTQNQFSTLPVVGGNGAPEAAGTLFAAMGSWPALVGQLKEAVYVANRRWDLKFMSGVTVMLPEDTTEYGLRDALPLLAKLEDTRHVLTLVSGTVDLRLPDRIIMNLPDAVGATPVTSKPATSG